MNSGDTGAKVLQQEPRYLKMIDRLRMAQFRHVYDEQGTPFGDTDEGFERWLRAQSVPVTQPELPPVSARSIPAETLRSNS